MKDKISFVARQRAGIYKLEEAGFFVEYIRDIKVFLVILYFKVHGKEYQAIQTYYDISDTDSIIKELKEQKQRTLEQEEA